jgi:hypothetical protein
LYYRAFFVVDQKSTICYNVVIVNNKEQKMAEVRLSRLYKVTMTEYDNGAQHDMGTKFFDNEREAQQFCEEYAGGTSDCYFRARYEQVA